MRESLPPMRKASRLRVAHATTTAKMTLAQRVAYLARPVHLRRRVRHVSPLRWPTPAQNYLVRESRQIPCPGCTWGWLHRLSQVQLSGLWRDVYALRYSLFAPCGDETMQRRLGRHKGCQPGRGPQGLLFGWPCTVWWAECQSYVGAPREGALGER